MPEKTQTELAAELVLVTAKKQLVDMQHQLDEASKPPDAALKEAVVAKARLDAQKGVLDAEAALAKAKFPAPDRQATEGTVTLAAGAGAIEAHLLATKAVREAAASIAAALDNAIGGKTTLLFPASQIPKFQAVSGLLMQTDLAERALNDALKMAPQTATAAAVGPELAAAGAALDAITRLLSFFKADFNVSGVDVTTPETVLVAAVAKELKGKNRKVRTPSLFNPGLLDAGLLVQSGFVERLTGLAAKRSAAASERDGLTAEVTRLDGQIAAVTAGADPAALKQQRGEASKKRDTLQTAITVADAMLAKLTSADDAGRSLLAQAMTEAVLAELVKESLVVSLNIDKSGGGILTKKTLWTMLGRMPLYHMGGAAVTYIMWDGATGDLLASGTEAVYGGFVKSGKLRQELSN